MAKLQGAALVGILCLAAVTAARAEDVVVTQYKADPSGAPFGVALAKGYFKQAGVDITDVISGEGGGNSVRNMIASPLGFGETSPAPVISAIKEGQDLKIVSLDTRSLASNVVIVMPDSPIKTPADMKGKKFGISNPKSLGEMTAVMVIEQAGLKPDDVERVALGSLTGALTALESGAVQVTSIPGILFRMRGGASKYRVLVGPRDLPLMAPAIGIASTDLMKKNPDKLRAILAARREAVKFINQNPVEAAKILAPIYAPLPPQGVEDLMKELADAHFYSEGGIEMASLNNVVRAMRYTKMIDEDVDLTKMIDTSFLPADLRK